MPATLVAETEFTQVFYRPGTSHYTLVTFNEAGTKANGQFYWGSQLAERLDLDCIGFVSKFPHWFPIDDTKAAIARIAHLIKRPTVCYGHSQGAYAAIKFSSLLNARLVVSFCPQTTIDPTVTPDIRYKPAYRKDLHTGMSLAAADAGPLNEREILVIYDPFEDDDRRHAEDIRATVGCTLIPAYLTGHCTVRCIANSKVFSDFIESAFRGDRASLKEIVRRGKKSSHDIVSEMAVACFRRGKFRTAMALMVKSEAMGHTKAPLRTQLITGFLHRSKYLIRKGNLSEAERSMLDAIKQFPTEFNLHASLGYIQSKMKNTHGAELSFLRALSYNNTAVNLYVSLADTLILEVRLEEAIAVLKKAHSLDPTSGVVATKLESCQRRWRPQGVEALREPAPKANQAAT